MSTLTALTSRQVPAASDAYREVLSLGDVAVVETTEQVRQAFEAGAKGVVCRALDVPLSPEDSYALAVHYRKFLHKMSDGATGDSINTLFPSVRRFFGGGSTALPEPLRDRILAREKALLSVLLSLSRGGRIELEIDFNFSLAAQIHRDGRPAAVDTLFGPGTLLYTEPAITYAGSLDAVGFSVTPGVPVPECCMLFMNGEKSHSSPLIDACSASLSRLTVIAM